MTDTTFTDNDTVIRAVWLNAVNDFVYDLFGGATTVDGALTVLDGGTRGTLAGTSNAETLSLKTLKDYGVTYVAHGNSGAAETIDLENGNVHGVTLTDNCTFTFSNPPASGTYGEFRLILTQDGTGSRTATWPASVVWTSGTAPTLSTAASAIDVIDFFTVDGGTTWFGTLVIQAAA